MPSLKQPGKHRFKGLVEDSPALDIFQFNWNGLFAGGPIKFRDGQLELQKGETSMLCDLAIGDFGRELGLETSMVLVLTDGARWHQKIGLVQTPCHFGGLRYWFLCDCGKRVAKLYGPSKETAVFACRTCCDLTYRSCRLRSESRKEAWRIRQIMARSEARWRAYKRRGLL